MSRVVDPNYFPPNGNPGAPGSGRFLPDDDRYRGYPDGLLDGPYAGIPPAPGNWRAKMTDAELYGSEAERRARLDAMFAAEEGRLDEALNIHGITLRTLLDVRRKRKLSEAEIRSLHHATARIDELVDEQVEHRSGRSRRPKVNVVPWNRSQV